MKTRRASAPQLTIWAAVAVLSWTAAPAQALAQALEESIESELDKLGDGAQPAPPASPDAFAQPAPAQTQMAPEPAALGPQQPEAPAPYIPPPSSQAAGASIDPPNLELENRLYRIFHNAKPIAEDKWDELLGSRREDAYKVQSGDTLWDISQTMFGDGFFWSKLWAENSSVENPHRIEKGQAIRFVAGNEEEPPSISVVKDGFSPVPIKINAMAETSGTKPTYREEALQTINSDKLDDNSIEVDELVPTPEIPPGKPRRKVTNLPPSFKPPIRPSADKGYDITGLDAGRVRSLTEPGNIVPTSIILEQRPSGVGTVDEVEAQERFAAVGQHVFLRMKRATHAGERFSVMKEREKIDDPKVGTVGPVMEIGGTVEVTGPVDENKKIYRAVVIKSINPVHQGSVVLEEPLPTTNFARRGTLLNSVVRIIGGEYDEERKILGEGSVVYLGGGASSGLSPGDLLAVQARRGERRDESRYSNWSRSIGVLKIVKVEKKVATAIVLEVHDEIHTGDLTGGQLPETPRAINDDGN